MQKFGICLQTLIPVRATSSETAEMISQIIFGETYIINSYKENWVNITLSYDEYSGWIDIKQIIEIDENKFVEINRDKNILSSDIFSFLKNQNTGEKIPLVAGSNLPFIDNKGCINIDKYRFKYLKDIKQKTHYDILEVAKSFLNAPYLWGGRTILGIDCSGFSQIVYKIIGIKIDRDASMQAKQGRYINNTEDIKAGDLAFFKNEDNKITHVGIILSLKKIIHASGWVRIDDFDKNGIFNIDNNKYTHTLHSIRRFF